MCNSFSALTGYNESMKNEKQNDSNEFFRFHLPHLNMSSVFGDDWFALKAEAFARFFGTPIFLIVQTCVVLLWVILNLLGYAKFDLYPFILLNLAFSLQSAYAAPLILLAQTRQSDRDKVHSLADAQHREDLASAAEQRQLLAARQTEQLSILLKQNTEMTNTTHQLALKIELLTRELHEEILKNRN
jgi:uncharacterized membrane protein